MLRPMTETQRKIGFLVCLVTIVLAVLDLQIVSAATVLTCSRGAFLL